MNQQVAMSVFVEVARNGSFSGAARRLGMSTTAVSRHVADLEGVLGVTLLRRTTRRVNLTDAGSRYLPRAAAILDEIARLNAAIRRADEVPRGTLRITAPPAIGHDLIVPLVLDFAEAYSEIEIDLDLSERLVDLVAEGFDAAIRSGPLDSSRLVARRIAAMPYALYASPDYLATRGVPSSPREIAEHDCLHWHSADGSGIAGNWSFSQHGAEISVPVRRRLVLSDLAALREAAVRGLGLAVLPAQSARADVVAGRLVAVLADYALYSDVLHLVWPRTSFRPSRLRVFADFIVARIRQRATDTST